MGWILFRADNLPAAVTYYRDCFGMAGNPLIDDSFREYVRQYAAYLIAGTVLATPVLAKLRDKIGKHVITDLIYAGCLTALFIASISFLVKGSYNPFIYFNF